MCGQHVPGAGQQLQAGFRQSAVERKTGWMTAEQAGLSRPWRMQGLLGRKRWDADALRDEVGAYAVEALGCADGVLVVDETGFMKKGRHSIDVARQYTGTTGRMENSQVGVFLAYAGRFGQALIDRRLYLPRDWAADGARRAKTSVPEEVAFATKPALAREMIAAALDADMPCAFVLADTVYGSDSCLRRMLEERGQSYVLGSTIVSDNQFDQVAFFPGEVEDRRKDSRVFDFDGAVFADYWKQLSAKHASYQALKNFRAYVRYHLSDHRILWAQFSNR